MPHQRRVSYPLRLAQLVVRDILSSSTLRQGNRMRLPTRMLSLLPILGIGACAQEATGPQGVAAISRVVPAVAPDVWCPASADSAADTVPAQHRCHTTENAPPLPLSRDSTWQTMQGSLKLVGDSGSAAPDTTR